MVQSILAIWTRDVESGELSGRMKVLRGVRDVAAGFPGFREVRYYSVFESYGKLGGLGRFVLAIAKGLITFRPVPLQCAMYANTKDVIARIGEVREDVVLLDSIRQADLLAALRRKYPDKKYILDMDDLMSRRMTLTLENDLTPSLGFFGSQTPSLFAKLMSSKLVSRLILRYEAGCLKRMESWATRNADKVIMVSSHEAEILARDTETSEPKIAAVAPPVEIPVQHIPFGSTELPTRFAFIGTDKLLQNATAIDDLISIWRDVSPSSELVIYGSQARQYQLPQNVRLGGFASSLLDVYDGRTVLLMPTRLAGGVKTKFLEAFAYGAPVVGNKVTFEGVPWSEAFLTLDELGGPSALVQPEGLQPVLARSAQVGRKLIAEQYSSEAFSDSWRSEISKL